MAYNPLSDARARSRLRASAIVRTANIMRDNGATFAEIAQALYGNRQNASAVARMLEADDKGDDE